MARSRPSERLVFRLKREPGYVDGTGLSDADLARLPANTVFLDLENARITDAGIHSLPALTNLRCIDLDSTVITDHALTKIASFLNLEEIWVESTQITDKGLAQLSHLSKLRFISVLDCPVSEQGIAQLREAIPAIEVH